jgi:hypothetical protein
MDKDHLEDELASILLRRLNNHRYRIELVFWGCYLGTWLLAVLFVYLVLVETDLIVQP